jgi:flagellar hook-associated protein 3 FlgL
MSAIPSNLARVPNMLANQIMLGSLQRTGGSLLSAQVQLATGRLVNRPSDNAVSASTISVLDDLIERREQRLRNLSHAEGVLNNVDASLGAATELVLEAKTIGLSQIGVGSDAGTRALQAVVIDSMLTEMVSIGNRQFQQIHLFGGAATGAPPLSPLNDGWLYRGRGEGLLTDLGLGHPLPITVSGKQAFGAVSARVQGDRDLDPALTGQTRIADLRGARGSGVALGAFNMDVGGTVVSVDLTGAYRMQDVIDALQTAVQSVDAGAVVQINAAGTGIEIEPSAGVDITMTDLVGQATAADLGITGTFSGGAATSGADLNPRLTPMTRLDNLNGVTVPLGSIHLANGGHVRELDLSTAETVQDIMVAVAALNIGVRVEIAESGDRLNFVNELSGASGGGMSIGEVGGGDTATQLGVRSLTGSTLLADFNNGMGVQIVAGSIDPVTGLPNPAADVDFRITAKDGTQVDVDLAGALTVQDVLDRINAAAAGAGLAVPADFEATLAEDGNGIAIRDGSAATGATSVVALNGSFAAHDLGILGSTDSATLTGQDRATVAVDSVISHLAALRDALQANDERGISLATKRLEADLERLAQTRADVGARTRRVTDAVFREEELQLQDQSLKSQLQDLDYTEAAIRFATLQQQLQAGLQTAGRVNTMSLLDFLR